MNASWERGAAPVSLRLEEIADSRDFLLRFEEADEGLAARIRKSGFMVPVLVLKRGGRFEVLSGFRRWHAARILGWDCLPALCFEDPLPGRKELFEFALLLNDPAALTDLDRAVLVAKARDRFGFSWKELEALAPLAGIPPSERFLEEIGRVGRMPYRLLREVADGHIPFQGARALAGLAPQGADVLVSELAGRCELSASEWVQAAEWLSDLVRKRRVPFSELFQEETLRAVLDREAVPARERGKRFFENLRKIRFPLVSDWEERFRALQARVAREGELALEAPPAFEGKRFTVVLKVTSAPHLASLIDHLRRNERLFKKLFDLVE